ncbi:MAG: cation diffusion facilitator family transporter [Bifidobacteriaceae bacterium]|jgi:cation diffusion facilitator family transporter|nr:cation diffusion facilitator family transporter [Bifidobacteriaceae bacterium]
MNAVMMALVANVGVAIAKFVAFLLTRSASMLAESIHSLADTTNQLLLLLGKRHSKKKPNEEHQFGYGRARYFYSFLVAILLFAVGGVFSVYQSIQEIMHPSDLDSPIIAIVILIIGMILEGLALRTSIIETKHIDKKFKYRNVLKFIEETKNSDLPVVLLEDTAALIGLSFAMAGVVASMITKNPIYDAVGSGAIGILLLIVAVFLGSQMGSLLIGESADDDTILTIENAVKESNVEIIHLRTDYLSPDQLLITLKIAIDGALSAKEIVDIINDIERAIRRGINVPSMIFVEPDIKLW